MYKKIRNIPKDICLFRANKWENFIEIKRYREKISLICTKNVDKIIGE